MEDFFFGGGWLEELLKERGGPPEIRDKVRKHVRKVMEGNGGGLLKEWKSIDELLEERLFGEALDRALKSLNRTVEALDEITGGNRTILEKPFSPFLVKSYEIKKVLHPAEDLEELVLSRDDLDAVLCLEIINDIRRLLASWGAGVWGNEPLKLIPRLEKDLEELKECQALLADDELEDFDLEFSEKEVELADRMATIATRFASDLFDLHLLNARNPEVRLRFSLLWGTVKELEKGKNTPAAAFEALQVLEEALDLAGLGGGELLSKIDLLYEHFSEAEDLRQAVDRLVNASRDGDEGIRAEQGRWYINAISEALEDLGLEVG
jgi:hypothetical protein